MIEFHRWVEEEWFWDGSRSERLGEGLRSGSMYGGALMAPWEVRPSEPSQQEGWVWQNTDDPWSSEFHRALDAVVEWSEKYRSD